MRELLQRNRLRQLGQCDPFEATVDAAIFVAQRESMRNEEPLLFVQARYSSETSQPEQDLPKLLAVTQLMFSKETKNLDVKHAFQGCVRVHHVPIRIYRDALKRAFFEPRPAVLGLYRRFNEPLKSLVEEWYDRVDTSQKFSDNLDDIRAYHAKLKPHDVTLVGLIAEGAQGMRTANNARFLGYLNGTPQAERIKAKREEWTRVWMARPQIKEAFLKLVEENGGDPNHPTANVAAWEACVEPLKGQFDARHDLNFSKTDLYRVVPTELIATGDDFLFTWKTRKAELLSYWQAEASLNQFWNQRDLLEENKKVSSRLKKAIELPDENFCKLCQDLLRWWEHENKKRRITRTGSPSMPRAVLGLHQSETYSDSRDAPRIAAIYNGLSGRRQWVPFRKGDPEGDRWADNEPLFIYWTPESVKWLSEAPEARWQGHRFFFTPGVTWSLHANHTRVKARYQEACVFDASGSRLTPVPTILPVGGFLAIVNSDVFSFFLKKFIKHNQDVEINDLRKMPLVIPTQAETELLAALAKQAIAAKRCTFAGELPPNELVLYVRSLSAKLVATAPKYLHPPAQLQLLSTASDCPAVIELAVNWEVEKLYGVEGLGPFDEF
jgi:hypothetical protein